MTGGRVNAALVSQAIAVVAARSAGPRLPAGAAVTLNFHPDALLGSDLMIVALARDGIYRSQFETGTSNGGLTAHPGGERWRWESRMFGGVYDNADPALRPRYGALNHRHWPIGGSPRFGSAHLRLHDHVLDRTSFCYPDSHLEPQDFGVADRMNLVALADANAAGLDVLDDYVEAHVHGPIDMAADVAAVVLDPCYRGTPIEAAARALPCPIEWHDGFRLAVDRLADCAAYRSPAVAAILARLAVAGVVTPKQIGLARQAPHDPQQLKQAWHCVARFGGPFGFAVAANRRA